MISVFHSIGDFSSGTYPDIRLDGLAGYSHQIQSIGGFTSASISFNTNLLSAENWVLDGVGRHIRSYSERGNIVWEGLVNSVSFSIGTRALTVGNYLDISNRVKVIYTLRNPPIGTPNSERNLETDWAQDADSSIKYGVLEQLISGGSGYSQGMDALRDQTLADNLGPDISERLSTNEGAPNVSVSLSCIGYTRLLEKQTYKYGTSTEYDDLSVKIGSILDANANVNIFVHNRDIRNVNLQVLLHETQRRTGWGIIKDDISKSADSGSNIVCGMFGSNTFVLDIIRNRSDYSRDGGSNVIIDSSRNEILPSEALPGRMMQNNDLSIPIKYRIDSVSYNLTDNVVSLNEQARSIRSILSRTMLGGLN